MAPFQGNDVDKTEKSNKNQMKGKPFGSKKDLVKFKENDHRPCLVCDQSGHYALGFRHNKTPKDYAKVNYVENEDVGISISNKYNEIQSKVLHGGMAFAPLFMFVIIDPF